MARMEDEGLERQQAASETTSVRLTLRLPHDMAEQAKAVQKQDPEFLSRIVMYGLTRRSIYRQLRKVHDELVHDGLADVFERDTEDGVEPIPEDEGKAILEENEAGAPDEPDGG